MALFKATKSYFDGWLKSLISYALQPTIVAAFMALMYSIFDNVLYGTCQFSRSTLNPMIFNRSIDIFSLSSTAGGDPNCTNSFGYLIGGITASNGIGSKMMLFFQIPQLSSWVVAAVYWQLIIGLIFAFLFYYFAMSVEQFASSLTGGAKLGLATSPGKFADAAYNKMTNMAVGMMSDKGGGGKGGDGLTASTTRGGGASGAADAKNAPVGGGDANG
jgi:type IV secretion system protein VirB6